MSGLFTASFALGNFCGPTLSGIIYDQAGFSYNCLVLQFLVAIVLVLNIICYFVPEGEPEYEAIPDTPTAGLSGLDRRDSVFPEPPADVIRSVVRAPQLHCTHVHSLTDFVRSRPSQAPRRPAKTRTYSTSCSVYERSVVF